MTILAGLALLLGATGCALFRPPPRVSLETDESLSRGMKRNLLTLASTEDVLNEDAVNEELLRLSTRADEQNMTTYLRAQGFFDASVTSKLMERKQRPHVRFYIHRGPEYLVDVVDVEWDVDGENPVVGDTSRTGDHLEILRRHQSRRKNGLPLRSGDVTFKPARKSSRPMRASSSAILGVRGDLIRLFREQGYPEVRVTRQEIIVDHASRSVHPMFELQPGPFTRLGELSTEGLVNLRDSYVAKGKTWKPGYPYDVRKVELLERRLAASGLFSSIQVRRDEGMAEKADRDRVEGNAIHHQGELRDGGAACPQDAPAERDAESDRVVGNASHLQGESRNGGAACPQDAPTKRDTGPDRVEGNAIHQDEKFYDVRLTLRERRPRTVQLGVGYRTDTGGEVSAQWQNRNALGGGENFSLRGRVTEQGYDAETRMIVPFFRRSDQQWGTSLIYRDEETDAFDTLAVEAETWISREITRHLVLSTGIGLRYLDETQAGEDENYLLLSFPQRIGWDRSNNLLDATRGYRVLVRTEPFQSLNETDVFFWKNLATLNGFLPLTDEDAVALALRVTTGSISGTSLNNVPAEVRFYAGGGQSVRGYEYQSLSPRNEKGEIIGGMSLLESSLEVRLRASDSLGAVVFVDGGAAFDETVADFSETYRWGAGVGFRYFTPVGPLRADLGFPLNKRDGIDKDLQFYISIGQAF